MMKLKIPTKMIHQSFRYIFGRRSHAVSEWVDWCVVYWDVIPDEEKRIIKREIEEAFSKKDYVPGSSSDPIGMACERREWERIRILYKHT